MGFKEAVRTCLREKYFTFSGRASRSEYWYFSLFFWLVLVLGGLIVGFGFGGMQFLFVDETDPFAGSAGFPVVLGILLFIFGIVAIGLYFATISVMVRRFHDRNLSGWWVLGAMIGSNIPYIGIPIGIAALVMTILKGTDGPNKFGDDPLNPATDASVFA